MCQMCVDAQVRLFLELLQLSIWGTSWDVPLCRLRRRWRGQRQHGSSSAAEAVLTPTL